MKNKYIILALTFLCLLLGQQSFGQLSPGDHPGDYDGSGDIWVNDSGFLMGEDEDGRLYADINEDGYLDHNEVIEFVPEENDGTGSPETGSPPSWQTDWAGSYSGSLTYNPNGDCWTCNTDDDSSNDVASSDYDYYYTGSSLGLSSVGYSNYTNVTIYTGPSYVDKKGNVFIKLSNGTYKKPSELNPNSDSDRQALNQFAATIARNLNDNNYTITIASNPGTSLASKVPAYATGNTITLNSNGGFSKDLDNVNNFKSILKHEIFHVDDNRNGVNINKYEMHADVYLNQMKHTSFKNTTLDFKNSVAKSFCNYLLNIDQENMRDQTIYNHDTVILDRIKQFNNDHLGVMTIIAPEFGKYITGQLSLEVKMNGYIAQPVNYTYEIN